MRVRPMRKSRRLHRAWPHLAVALIVLTACVTSSSQERYTMQREAMVREQIRTLRHLISELRPLALDTLGLPAALRDLAERAADSGVLVRCDVDALPDATDPTAAASVYRIVQEAVTNALRHAACHEIAVSVSRDGDVVRVHVRDDGIGLAPGDAPGQGRRGMAERADALGARLAWTAPATGGTDVALDVPLSRLRPAA